MLSSLPQAKPHLQTGSHNTALLHRLTGGHVLAIAPDTLGGLLLVKGFYVDFAGPGAAVGGGFDRACTAVYAIGTVRFQTLLTSSALEAAIQARVAYAEQLAAIVSIPQAVQRARLMATYLAEWLPGNLSLTISSELMAGLAGVLPGTVHRAWQTHKELSAEKPLADLRHEVLI
ncbi:MAG: hypothetical protein NW224_22345 [Leptolyngbyaceae cyanobacterium bins.302]|nr:hypothetical protein [Leptolyngbyaceae cyanobacterium bins.302]